MDRPGSTRRDVPRPGARGARARRAGRATGAPSSVTSGLLGLVSLLFVALVVQEAWKLVAGAPPGRADGLREVAHALAERALDAAETRLAGRVEDPDDPLYLALRLALRQESYMGSWIPVGVARDEEGRLEVRDGGVRLEVGEKVAVLEGDLPHRGRLRLEVTILRSGEEPEVVTHRSRELGYRVIRTRPPLPFAARALTVEGPGIFLDRTGAGDLGQIREDLDHARRALATIEDRRIALRGHLQEVRETLGSYLRAFRHLDGAIENPLGGIEVLAGDALAPIPPASADPRGDETWARSGQAALDLGRWAELPAELSRGEETRRVAKDVYLTATRDWEASLRRAFRSARWEPLRDRAELEFRAKETADELEAAAGRLVAAREAWARAERARVEAIHEAAADLGLVAPNEARGLDARVRLLDPATWRPQAEQVVPPGQVVEALRGRRVIFVENDPGPPVVLDGVEFSGQEVVLVATGEVRLRDVRRGPGGGLLTVQAQGRLSVEGEVDAFLVARGGLDVRPGARLRGGLVLLGSGERRLAGWVEWDPRLASARSGGVDELEGLAVQLGE